MSDETGAFSSKHLKAKADMWREEAQSQPDRAEEMLQWAECFAAMAAHLDHGRPSEETRQGRGGGNPHHPFPLPKRHTPAPRRAQERFGLPDWMQDNGHQHHQARPKARAPGL
jgi:hypothetical protein